MRINAEQVRTLQEQGYCAIQNYLNPQQAETLKNEYKLLIAEYYNDSELEKHSVYPSDKSEARESHAMMISEGKSDLPKIDHDGLPMLNRLLQEHHKVLGAVTGQQVSPSARSLVNFQSYSSGSKPVGEHFDGEYLRAQRDHQGIEFKLLEGILPRYVSVIAIENENEGKGVELIDPAAKKLIQPNLGPGDLVIFDNINLRHKVPELEKPRISIGIRNFDHLPMHFAASKEYFIGQSKYSRITEGFISKEVDCYKRFKEFLEIEWPKIKKEYGSYV